MNLEQYVNLIESELLKAETSYEALAIIDDVERQFDKDDISSYNQQRFWTTLHSRLDVGIGLKQKGGLRALTESQGVDALDSILDEARKAILVKVNK